MNILYKSFHNINVPENAIRVIPIPEDFDEFMIEFLLYSLQNESIKRYKMIDDLVGNYIPDAESLNMNTIKEKLLDLTVTKTFDTQFNAVPTVIKKRKRTEKYFPSAGIETAPVLEVH